MKKACFLTASLFASVFLGAWEYLCPQVFPVQSTQEIKIKAQSKKEIEMLKSGTLFFNSGDATWQDGEYHNGNWEKLTPVIGADNTFSVKVKLGREGDYWLRLGIPKKKPTWREKMEPGYAEFGFYALEDDLLKLRPWKGDIHQHSTECGHAKAKPQEIPAYARRAGFDFTSLSEHRLRKPSLDAIAANAAYKCDMRMFPAEEFHSGPRSEIHSLAIGHECGVNDWVKAHASEYEARWKAEMKNPQYAPLKMNKHELEYAAKGRVLYQIAKANKAKLVVNCHPADCMTKEHRNMPPKALRRAMMEFFNYDAIELPNGAQGGGLPRISLVNAMAMEEIAKGRNVGFVSVSDCHSHKTHPRYGFSFTVIFAPDCDVDNFASAVKSRRSLAARAWKDRRTLTEYLYFGPSRLVVYQEFLEKMYWRKHDELCRRQGELLLRLVAGDESVRPKIAEYNTAVKAYRDKFFSGAKAKK